MSEGMHHVLSDGEDIIQRVYYREFHTPTFASWVPFFERDFVARATTTLKPSEILTDSSRWTQCAFGRTIHGVGVAADDPLAVCWCASGLLLFCYPKAKDRIPASDKLYEAIGGGSILVWNDQAERTFQEVKDAFVKAGL